ncbi:MAG: DUF3365 domain-containing protein, partial [Pseudorhodoplanes sp.]
MPNSSLAPLRDLRFNVRNSIAWRLLLPVPIVLVIAIGSIWAVVPRVVASIAINDATLTNRQVANEFQIFRSYYSENVVNKVIASGAFKATTDHKTNPEAIPLPATLVHDLSARLAGSSTTVTLFSPFPFPDRVGRKLDAFQQEAWDYLNQNPNETFVRSEVRNGRNVVRVAIADKMAAQGCINCHNTDSRSPKKDWQLGDVRGVLEVTSVIDAQLAHGETLSRLMVAGAVLIGLILLAITLVVARGLTVPLAGMVTQMRKLANGDFDVVLPGLGRRDEIGAMAEAVESFKLKAMERARREAEQEDARKQSAADERRAEMHRLADHFEADVGTVVSAIASLSHELESASGTLTNNSEKTRELSGVVAGASDVASVNVQSVAVAAQELTASVSEISRQ